MKTKARITIELITPAVARILLSRMIKTQRPLSEGRVAEYAHKMRSGEWKFTGNPIQITADNVVINGQHVLNAIIKSTSSVEHAIARGVEYDALQAIDTHKPRTLHDILALLGLPYTKRHTQIVTGLCYLECGTWGAKPSVPEAERVSTLYGVNVEWGTRYPDYLRAAGAKLRSGGSPVRSALVFASARMGGDRDTFLRLLINGEGIEAGHPAFALRLSISDSGHRASSGSGTGFSLACKTLRAYECFQRGERIAHLTESGNAAVFERFRRIPLLREPEADEYAAPRLRVTK